MKNFFFRPVNLNSSRGNKGVGLLKMEVYYEKDMSKM